MSIHAQSASGKTLRQTSMGAAKALKESWYLN